MDLRPTKGDEDALLSPPLRDGAIAPLVRAGIPCPVGWVFYGACRQRF